MLRLSDTEESILEEIRFSDIPSWRDDDHEAALRTFLIGAPAVAATPPKTRALGIDGGALQRVAVEALALDVSTRAAACAFFERRFVPHRIKAAGFVTGYFEPEVAASRVPTPRFATPLYSRPPELVDVSEKNRPDGWDPELRFARKTEGGGLEPFFDRAAIENGALQGRGLELAFVESPVDAFYIHVQGSARLRLTDGGTLRIAFAGKSGHPYTSIGRLAVERGLISRDRADKDGLEAWLNANPDAARALMRENRSYIFFRETELDESDGPIGAAGVPLTALRSLAVDRTLHTFHTPVWVESRDLADPERSGPFRRLMIAQDTGSAIVGPARGDLFFGSGAAAGSLAGRVRHEASMVLFVPKAVG